MLHCLVNVSREERKQIFVWFPAALNFVAISEALHISPSVVAAGVAVDNVICAVYFMALFALASKIPSETSASVTGKLHLYHIKHSDINANTCTQVLYDPCDRC